MARCKPPADALGLARTADIAPLFSGIPLSLNVPRSSTCAEVLPPLRGGTRSPSAGQGDARVGRPSAGSHRVTGVTLSQSMLSALASGRRGWRGWVGGRAHASGVRLSPACPGRAPLSSWRPIGCTGVRGRRGLVSTCGAEEPSDCERASEGGLPLSDPSGTSPRPVVLFGPGGWCSWG